jgi:mono/diheme cytochrome c family protein
MKFFIYLLFIAVVIHLLANCQQTPKQEANPQQSASYTEGLGIIQSNCISCHSPKGTLPNEVAPSLQRLRKHYLDAEKTESAFINGMSRFLLKPEASQSRMPEAVKQFGLMPNLGYTKEQYDAVAYYLFHSKMEDPDWYDNQYLKETKSLQATAQEGAVDYLNKGREIALSAKAILGKNLLSAINTKGVSEALLFCNERAIPLTDSMAVALGASLKRVSDKNRNPANAAEAEELAYILEAKTTIQNQETANPKILDKGDKVVGFYPIMTNDMCLKCHGATAKDIDTKTLNNIRRLYPEDKATGYAVNELRGIWVVEMEKK